MTPERESEIRKIARRDGESWRSSKVSSLALKETLAELDALRWVVSQYEPPHEAFARVVNERNAARAEHRQFLADLGSIVAGMPVEPCEALRRVEELVRLRETSGDSTLAAEVRRLRAAVERVKEGNWITRFDVIAILEGTDDR